MKCQQIAFGMMLSLVVGCGGGDSPIVVEKPKGGKADATAISRLCKDAGEEPGCNICEIRQWYGDGECDTFCTQPDPDCTQADEHVCSADFPSTLGEDTSMLDYWVYGQVVVTAANSSGLTELQRQQIIKTAALIGEDVAGDDLAVVFDLVDGGEIFFMKLRYEDDAEYNWVKTYQGDTEVGAIFKASTLVPVGVVSDGSISGCSALDE